MTGSEAEAPASREEQVSVLIFKRLHIIPQVGEAEDIWVTRASGIKLRRKEISMISCYL
jgi:hypothetical protein